MNAIQFIKLYGLHSARVTVDDAQENTHYCTEAGYHSIKLDVAYEPCPDCVSIPDLKRLVDSVDLVKSYGGIINAKNELILLQKHLNNTFGYVTIITSEKIENLEQAIADYEQLFGNTETSELETLRDCDTSPNCKKFDERVK